MIIPDYIKTIINALKQYFATKKEVRQVVSDLNKKQNELISSGASVGQFLKIKSVDASGKPTQWEPAVAPSIDGYGYSEICSQVLLDKIVYVPEIGWEYLEYDVPLVLGNVYDITFNGVKYSNLTAHEVFDDMGRVVYVGDQNLNDPPFHVDYSEQLNAILVYPEYSKVPSEVSVKIERNREVVHQIDDKYIPSGAGLPEINNIDNGAFLVANGSQWVKSKGGVGWSSYDQDEEIVHKINPKYISDGGYGYTYKEVLVDNVSFKGEIQLENFYLVYGEKYDVTFDGIPYSNLEPYDDEGYITIGAPYGNYLDYPFNISHTEGDPPYVYTSDNINHVVTVSRSEEIIHKIDDKYLPTGMVFDSYEAATTYAQTSTKAYVGQSITVVDEANDIVTVYVISNSNMELSSVGGSASISDYDNIENKPKINGVTLVGNKTSEDLNINTVSMTNSDIEAIFTLE